MPRIARIQKVTRLRFWIKWSRMEHRIVRSVGPRSEVGTSWVVTWGGGCELEVRDRQLPHIASQPGQLAPIFPK